MSDGSAELADGFSAVASFLAKLDENAGFCRLLTIFYNLAQLSLSACKMTTSKK